jgi:uncharacterized membrane protein YcaP (DUF421 family)
MVGSIAARGVTGGAPFFVSLLGLAMLVAMHWIFSAIARGAPAFSQLIKGHATLLVGDGTVDAVALRRAHMSMDDPKEDLREKGITDLSELHEARLERRGKPSVLKP